MTYGCQTWLLTKENAENRNGTENNGKKTLHIKLRSKRTRMADIIEFAVAQKLKCFRQGTSQAQTTTDDKRRITEWQIRPGKKTSGDKRDGFVQTREAVWMREAKRRDTWCLGMKASSCSRWTKPHSNSKIRTQGLQKHLPPRPPEIKSWWEGTSTHAPKTTKHSRVPHISVAFLIVLKMTSKIRFNVVNQNTFALVKLICLKAARINLLSLISCIAFTFIIPKFTVTFRDIANYNFYFATPNFCQQIPRQILHYLPL